MANKIKLLRVLDYNIPMCGNKHYIPYFKCEVTDGTTTKIVKTHGDLVTDTPYTPQHIIFNRKRYKVVNVGTMYSPKIELRDYKTNVKL